MALVKKYQNNFTAGILSPGVSARSDLAKYADGCSQLVNAVVLAHGGVTKRPGTSYVDTLEYPGLLIPFSYSANDTCVLCFYGDKGSNASMRIYFKGAPVTRKTPDDSDTATETEDTETESGGSGPDVYEIETPYLSEHLGDIKFAQSADVLFLVHPSYPVYKLERFAYNDWRFSTLDFSPAIQPPSGLKAEPSGFEDSTDTYVETEATYAVAAVNAREQESLPCPEETAAILSTWPNKAKVTLTWNNVPGAVRYEVYKNTRGYYTWIGSTKDTEFIDDNIEGDDTIGPKEYRNPFAVLPVPDTESIEVSGEADIEDTEGGDAPPMYYLRVAYGTADGVVGVACEELDFAGKLDDLELQAPVMSGADLLYVYWRSEGSDEWTAVAAGADDTEINVTKVTVDGTSGGAYLTQTFEFAVSAVVGGVETECSAPILKENVKKKQPFKYTISWETVEGAESYCLYIRRKDAGEDSFEPWRRLNVTIWTGKDDDLVDEYGVPVFKDGVFVVKDDIFSAKSTEQSPVNGLVRISPYNQEYLDMVPKNAPDNYPGAVGMYQQRLVFGRTNAEPQTVWMTETGAFDSMAVATPLRDDSAVTATVDTKQMNEIRHFIALRDMIMMTSGAEFKVATKSGTGAITPTSVMFPTQSYWGVSNVPPIVAGTSIIFVQNSGRHVRDLQYTLQEDGYSGNEVSILADSLFTSDIVDWAFQRSPYSTVWVCLDEGKLLTFTYMKEQEIWAWSEHESYRCEFKSVASVREGADDAVYFLTYRDEHYYIEYQKLHHSTDPAEDAFYVDCGLRYDGIPISKVTGLAHLAGNTIDVLADGSAIEGVKVDSDGNFELDTPASKIIAGLPYTMKLETLDPDIKSENGSVVGEPKSIVKAVFKVRGSRSFTAGPSADSQVPVKLPLQDEWGEPHPLYTGTVSVNLPGRHRDEATLTVISKGPVPCTILGINQFISVG